VKWLHTLCSTLPLLKSNALFFYCTAEMGGGERGKEALASALAKKIRLPIPEKYQRGIVWVEIFFRVAAMALAILHNVIIGHFCVGIVAYERGEMSYNATLCNLASADLHTGINGTVVVVGVKCLFALFFSHWYSSLQPQERGLQCAVERWQKTTQKV